jgi:hypothetical protein
MVAVPPHVLHTARSGSSFATRPTPERPTLAHPIPVVGGRAGHCPVALACGRRRRRFGPEMRGHRSRPQGSCPEPSSFLYRVSGEAAGELGGVPHRATVDHFRIWSFLTFST